MVQQETAKKITNVRKNFTIFNYNDIFHANQFDLTPAHSMTKNISVFSFNNYYIYIISHRTFEISAYSFRT